MTDVLDLIDGALRDYDLSADAMRWTADPPQEPEPGQLGPDWVDVGWTVDPPYAVGSPELHAIMPAICAWLTANRVDPTVVPIWSVPAQVGRWLLYDAYAAGRDGSKGRIDPTTGELVMEVRRQRLFVPAPEVLEPWLASADPDDVDRLLVTWHRRYRRIKAMRRAYCARRRHRR